MSRAVKRSVGTDRVLAWLLQRGYRLVARRLRVGGTVLELVMVDGQQVVFVHVRILRRRGAGGALELIDRRRARHMVRAVGPYLAAHPAVPSVRIDVVTVTLDGRGGWRLAHYVNAVP
ncbi:MAG: YraN family protein [Thermoanaerobaculia bacterium]